MALPVGVYVTEHYLAMSSATAYSPRPIPAALYASASARYQRFCTELRTIDGVAFMTELGKVIVKPSCIWDHIKQSHDFEQMLIAGFRAPMVDQKTGKVIALSMNTDGTPISEEQWAREVAEAAVQLDAKHVTFAALCNTANAEIKAMCEAEGFSVVEFYDEFNRRGAALKKSS